MRLKIKPIAMKIRTQVPMGTNLRFNRKNHHGVALVFFALIFGMFLAFFMLIINSGVMIWQKMRLQTAVDLGSYAAASVSSAYLGNYTSGEQSIQAKNFKIREEYFQLLEDINKRPNRVPFPGIWPDPGSCAVACNAMNVVVAGNALKIYDRAKDDIMDQHAEVRRILQQLPKAMQKAAEATVKLNVPELSIDSNDLGALGDTTNKAGEIIDDPSATNLQKRKNAVLTFSSAKGMYLANVVGAVPHRIIYFGPACADATRSNKKLPPMWYCLVNGAGAAGDFPGLAQALAAYALGREGTGNIGKVSKLADLNSNSIPLHFVENPNYPKPFAAVAAEWFPEGGTFMNLENSLGAKGSLFPKRTRLVAVSLAEPFGGSLSQKDYMPFGVRLAGIRKILLDPRMNSVKADYGDLWKYMKFLGPKDASGGQAETTEEVIKRFMH